VFPVLFGESAVREMEDVAAVTGGKVFDARAASLQEVFKEIRGYQ
jgi:Ca-activated chloride channel family protein